MATETASDRSAYRPANRPAHIRLPNDDSAREWARKYAHAGLPYLYWQVTDEDAGSGKGKGPTGLDATGWNSTRTYELPPPHQKPWQMGLFTGAEVSGAGREGLYLTVVDVDDPMMQAAVEASLPKTGLIGGRAGASRSHLFYLVKDGMPNSFKWLGPRRQEDGTESDGCLLELMGCNPNGTPRQVVVAPSLHYRTASDVVWAEFGEPAQVRAEDLYAACVRALSVREGKARLDGKGRPKPALHAVKESKKVKLAQIAASAQDSEGDRAGKPKAKFLSDDAAEAMIWHAEETVKGAVKGNTQNVLNAQAYNAASLLAGGDAEESWFEKLEERLTQAFDAKEDEGHDVRKWIVTVRRGIEQGRAAPRTRYALAGYELNDQGNADLLAQEWRDSYRYLTTGASDGGGKGGRGGWHEWDGKKWTPVDVENLIRATKDVFRWASAEAFRSTDKVWQDSAVTNYFNSQNRGKAAAAVELLRAKLEGGSGLAVPRETVDTDRWLVNCGNGIYDIKSGELRPHDRALLLTKFAPCNYVPGTESAMVRKALEWAFAEQPDPQACYDYLMSWFGYMATGDVSAQKLLVLFGNGQNGKTYLLEAVGRVLGNYAGTVQKSVLIQQQGGSESKCTDEIAELQGRRMGWFSELSMQEFLNEGRIKQLTGNGRLRARRLFEGSFEFDTHCKFAIDTNYQPKIRGTDHGILRRVKPLPYNRRLPDDAIIPDWKGVVFDNEGDGLLSMILEAAHKYSKHGLAPEPECVVKACEMFREDNDNIGCYVRECCEAEEDEALRKDSEMKVGAHDLYDRYRRWAIEGGYTPCNIKTFGAKLMEKGFEQVRTAGCRVWVGLKLSAGGMNELMQAADKVIEGNTRVEKQKGMAKV